MTKNTTLIICIILSICFFKTEAIAQTSKTKKETMSKQEQKSVMKLGAFSTSLSVKDLKASKLFYEKLGFTVLAGDFKKNYFIMKSGTSLIGLFHGMFEGNILTFNPGWDENGKNIDSFDDVRDIEKHLKEQGVILDTETKPNTTGPASVILKDPDGNVIFLDQHR